MFGSSQVEISRRALLKKSSLGFGWLAWSSLLAEASSAAQRQPHFAPKARRVIFLFMDGGVSHVDTFDPKPTLEKYHDQQLGDTWKPSARSQSVSPTRKWKQAVWKFQQRGESGLPVSDLFPHIARVADRLCVVRSLTGETPLHGAQNLLLHTGRITGGAPSVGSWVSYGLGSENENLPGYVLLNNDWVPNGGMQNFASSFLPAIHQASMIRAKGTPIDNITASDPATVQRAKLDLLAAEDRTFAERTGDDAVDSAIKNYETASQMQRLVPELADTSGESATTLERYGVTRTDRYQHFYALQCLRARRLIEAGVRFIEITCPLTHSNNAPWDQHGQLKMRHEENASITDQPIAALLEDLQARGLLDDTLVLWAGEMGRTPHCANADGRDHHVAGYSIWLAGGGIKPGMAYGATDDFGMVAVENELTIHDIHATVLHLLGLDHERLIYRFGGRDVRLTDVHGRVVREIIS